MITPYSGAYGYAYVSLRQVALGKARSFTMHRIMASLFIRNPKNLPEVDHLDANKMNYSLENLEWVTGFENKARRHKRDRALKRKLKEFLKS